jgi:(p)ppGpp synthase/HD superfamily hydrolase
MSTRIYGKYLTNVQKDEIGTQLVQKAKRFAETAHEGQFRKYTGEPYFVHPERVALRVTSYTGKYYVRAAAYLHDVLEDCPNVDLKLLHKEFGADVVGLIVELTNPSKNFPKLNRAARKEMDRAYLADVSADAQLIKIVDRLDNISDICKAPLDFQKMYKIESINLAQSLKKAPPGLVEQLIRECVIVTPE